jgi:hypothetical protein
MDDDYLSVEDSVLKRCAHLIFHSDNAEGLQSLLLELEDPLAVYSFPSTLVPNTDRTFLMACAKKGRYECCKMLLSLDSAASVNAQNEQGYTALHYASYQGNAHLAYLLLAAGADVEIRNSHNETAYETAMSGKRFELLRQFQLSPYFTQYLAKATLPLTDPMSAVTQSSAETTSASLSKPKVVALGISQHDAAQFVLHITEVGSGADKNLVGCEFACLSSLQQERNRSQPSLLSGSVHPPMGCIGNSVEDLYIGRARSNHVCISDLSLSKQHAVICYVPDQGFVVYDLGSKHGTFVEDRRIPSGTEFPPAGKAAASNAALTQPAHIAETGGKREKDSTVSATDEHSSSQGSAAYAPMYLREGMQVRFGRIYCTVVRKRQDTVLSSRYGL